MNSLWFPDIPDQLNKMYDLLRKVIADIEKIKRKLSNRELKKLVLDFKRVVETINLICIKIGAEYKVAKSYGKEMRISPEERAEIANKIGELTLGLPEFVETDAMQKFLGEHPTLAEKTYIKIYGEKEDYLLEHLVADISMEGAEKDFIFYIKYIQKHASDLLSELNEAIKASF